MKKCKRCKNMNGVNRRAYDITLCDSCFNQYLTVSLRRINKKKKFGGNFNW